MTYGYFRPVIQDVVEKYLDCGNPMCGFARIRCPGCGEMHIRFIIRMGFVCAICIKRLFLAEGRKRGLDYRL